MWPTGTSKTNSARAKLTSNCVAPGILQCAVLALVLLSCASVGYATSPSSNFLRGETIHFPADSKSGYGFKTIDASVVKSIFGDGLRFDDEDRLQSDNTRLKRAATDDSQNVDPKNRTTVAHLVDSHTTLLVHWVGEGSDVIMVLAKSEKPASSSFFLSTNYGQTFTDVSDKFMVDLSRKAVISNYYSARSFNSYYVFTDETNNCIFTTDNSGDNVVRHCNLPFSPRVIKLNPVNPRYILALDDQSFLKQLYLSEDYGENWRAVYSQVKSFYWGITPYDNESTIFVVEELPATSRDATVKQQVIKSDTLFRFNYETVLIMYDVVSFEIRDDYMYATKSVNLLGSSNNPHLQLWVSYRRGDFVNAEFPGNHPFTDFYVADASEGQLMVCAYINNSYSNLYVSDVTGYKFSLSLERIVYFNPKTITNQNWIRLYGNETFADITKLHGVSGIYIASQQTSDRLEVEEQRSMITYDKGGKWEMIKAPDYVIGNHPSNCTLANNCSLHLTQEFHRLYPGSQAYPILTQRSSPGLVIATGVLARTLKGEIDIFVSPNAGVTWQQVLSGNYFYASADHGGIILAVHQFIATDEVVFSVDEGETWQKYKIVQEPIRVYGLLTEPGENSTIFSIFGSLQGHHSWLIVQLDLKDLFQGKKCGTSDYKMWSVSEDLPNKGCLLGHVTAYQRRIPHALCYNGDDFVRQFEVSNCSCIRDDFECDFGFQDNHGICQRDLSVTDVDTYRIPRYCPAGSFYSYTRGYRKVPGDTCVGGMEHRYGPLQYSCPIQERAEFLLLTVDEEVKMIDLASAAQVSLLHERVARVAAIFDYEMNCLIYVELAGNIKRMCFAAQTGSSSVNHEVIHMRVPGQDVTSMAFDWTGRNIFYTDSNNTISVVNVDGRFQRTLYTSSNGVYKPQDIIVDPHHGYLFFVGQQSSASSNCSIFRAAMDGSSKLVEVVISVNVTSETSLTLDLETETFYWVTPSLRSGYKANIHGQEVSVLFYQENFQLPSSIGIYKNDIYVSTKRGLGILMANQHDLSVWYYFAFTPPVYKMVVVSNTSQHASSACSAYHKPCSQLCLPLPSANNHNRTCLCGDGYSRQIHPSSIDETCGCEAGEQLAINGTCIRKSNSTFCSPDKLTCHNGNCVLLTWKCDGDDDCGDGSDEIDCTYSTCSSSSFTCRSGKCIPSQWRCDRQDDCNDGLQSDELNCDNQTCSSDQFKCANNYCISKIWVCDTDNDCHDNSDEINCHNQTTTSCPPWYFTCDSGSCIDMVYHCNGRNDCSDGSDEKLCTHTSNCSQDWQFYCGPGQVCIFAFWHCDGEADCLNGTDELNCQINSTIAPPTTTRSSVCPLYSYRCGNGNCIGWEDVCNGLDDCRDNSDETDCGIHYLTTSPPVVTDSGPRCNFNQFYCHLDQRCLPISSVCNGHEDCLDGTDEENCATSCTSNYFQCAQGRCIPRAWVCDGDPDCPSGDDEAICRNHTVTCAPSDFWCWNQYECVQKSAQCNRVKDCDDGSDEFNCGEFSAVNCSTFNNAREVCCSNLHCGVFSANSGSKEGGRCRSMSEPLSPGSRNDCDYKCKDDQFKCEDNGMNCISFVQVCDRKPDCLNGHDELNCDACRGLDFVEGPTSTVTNTSVTFKISFNFTSLSYAELIPDLNIANLTWQNLSSSVKTVDKLKPYTTYFFVFFTKVKNVTCVLSSYSKTTAEGVSSAPRNVTAKVHIESDPITYAVDVTWRKPSHPNGNIISYVIYYQKKDKNGTAIPGVYSQTRPISSSETEKAKVFTETVMSNIHPNTTYDFWVTALTSSSKSELSAKVTLQVLPAQLLNITMTDVTNTSFKLMWSKADNAVGYKIIVRFPEIADFPIAAVSQMVLFANSTQGSIVVNGLCPGTTVVVVLQIMYANNLLGPELRPNNTQNGGQIQLKGTTPVATFDKIEPVEPTRILLKYNVTVGGPVEQYTIYYTYDENIAPVNISTTQLSHELIGLYACQNYFIWLKPAYPTCPFSQMIQIDTGKDAKAPPKSVSASVTLIEQHYSLNLTWKPSCSDSSVIPETYIIRVKVGNLPEEVFSYSNLEKIYPYVYDGTNYTFFIRTESAGSQETAPYTVFIPYIGNPYSIYPVFNDGNNVTLIWQFPPAGDAKNNFKQFVVTINGPDVTIVKNVTENVLNLNLQNKGTYSVTVRAESTTGRIIGEPGYSDFIIRNPVSSPNTGVITLSKTNLVSILVPVGVAIVVLVTVLVVYIVRHKRLQRSFLAFANSHYNIQSGTTTFSEDMGLDGDEPLIQGFSDDEPLVIA